MNCLIFLICYDIIYILYFIKWRSVYVFNQKNLVCNDPALVAYYSLDKPRCKND